MQAKRGWRRRVTGVSGLLVGLGMGLLLAGVGVVAPTVQAQTVDTGVLGAVTDASGAAIPAATVTITNTATGVSKVAHTGAKGTYEAHYLVPGTYMVSATANGFTTAVRTLTLALSQMARVNLPLAVGEQSTKVEVRGTAPLLNTTSGGLSSAISPEQTVNLPLNGRQFSQLAVETPGVSVSSSPTGARFIANGARNVWMQVNIDGTTAVDNRQNFVALFPSIDAIQEFRVDTSDYSAEYGGNAGAIVNVQLKSGSNQFHGGAWEFLRNDALDARNYFRPAPFAKNRLHRNQFGGMLGGPIQKNKSFFMVDVEAERSTQDNPGTSTSLTPAEIAGDFSAFSKPLINPFTGQPVPGNNLAAAGLLDPTAVSLAKAYMPAPNISGAAPGKTNYDGQSVNRVIQNQYLGRFDHSFSDSDTFFADYILNNGNYPSVQLNPNFPVRYYFRNQNLSSQYVHIFSPTLTNELRFGLMFGTINQLSPRAPFSVSKTLGINGFDTLGGLPGGPAIPEADQGFPQLSISGYLAMGDYTGGQAVDLSRTYQVVDNVSKVWHSHFLKFGADIRKVNDDADTANQPFGNESFNGQMSGNAAADFMMGLPSEALSPEGVPVNAIRQWRTGLYFQDNWTVNQKLTLNMGLRYDWTQVPQDRSNISRTLRFDLVPGQAVLWPPVGQGAQLYIQPQVPLEPRLGFAYSATSRTVVRGGFGLFDSAAHFDNVNILQLNPPYGASIEVLNPNVTVTGTPLTGTGGTDYSTLEHPLASNLISGTPTYDVVSEPPNRIKKNGYMTDWNLDVQEQLTQNTMVQLGYVGTKGTDLDTTDHYWNSPQPGPGAIQPRRPYPAYGQIRMFDTEGASWYHALQARINHQYAHGLSFTAAYTWSHMIDNQDGSSNASSGPQNPLELDMASERANSTQNAPQNLVLTYVWNVPGGDLGGFAGLLLEGWQSSGIVTFTSGQPFEILQSGDLQNTNNGVERPNLTGAPILLADPGPSGYLNPAAFSPSVLSYGNTPRNPGGLYGPGKQEWDLALSRSFRMPYNESHSLMFRAEFFNAFNHPNFSKPNATFGTGSFGTISSTNGDNRDVELALKYLF